MEQNKDVSVKEKPVAEQPTEQVDKPIEKLVEKKPVEKSVEKPSTQEPVFSMTKTEAETYFKKIAMETFKQHLLKEESVETQEDIYKNEEAESKFLQSINKKLNN